MSERNVTHATFTIERVYPHPVEKVYRAFSDPEAKRTWFGGEAAGFGPVTYEVDFREGGHERNSARHGDGPVHAYRATFVDIVPNERIVTTYDMDLDGTRISVSVATYEFRRQDNGTKLVLTEQGAFLDGFDKPEVREAGTKILLDALGEALDAGKI